MNTLGDSLNDVLQDAVSEIVEQANIREADLEEKLALAERKSDDLQEELDSLQDSYDDLQTRYDRIAEDDEDERPTA